MKESRLKEFFCSLPDPASFAGKNIYVWGIGSLAALYQESFAREKVFNIVGYTVSDGYRISNFTQGGGGLLSEKNFLPLQK